MPAVKCKAESFELMERGAFGGTIRHWYGADSLPEMMREMRGRNVVPRYKGAPGIQFPQYGQTIPVSEAPKLLEQWLALGANPQQIMWNQGLDDSLLILQGEVMRSTEHLTLRYSRVKKPMRVALLESEQSADGLKAVVILKNALCPASWDLLNELLDEYEGAVVEFATWSNPDVVNGRNTIFWEVRHY
jgi:hypothetical protein